MGMEKYSMSDSDKITDLNEIRKLPKKAKRIDELGRIKIPKEI